MRHSKRVLAAVLSAVMAAGSLPMSALAAEQIVLQDSVEASAVNAAQAIDGYYYATVNMEYADFYYGELNNVEPSSDTTVDLTAADKVASYRETGMYDAVTSATSTKSTRYATAWYETGVTNDETEKTSTNKETGETTITNTNLYGIKDVQIKIPAAVYDAYMAGTNLTGTAAKVQEYLKNATYSDTAFTTEYKQLNADGTFSKMISNEGTQVLTDATAVLSTVTSWGDYQIDIEGFTDENKPTTSNLYGIIVTDKDGNNYGMLHSDNAWLQTQEFSWAIDDVFEEPHGNHNPYLRTNGLRAGNTITKVTYLLKDTADLVIEGNVYIKEKIADAAGTATSAATTSNGTEITIALTGSIPSDADYTVGSVVKGKRHGTTLDSSLYSYDAETGVLTLDKSCAVGEDYVITMKSEKYGDIKISSGAAVTSAVFADDVKATIGDDAIALNASTNVDGAALVYSSDNEAVASVDENGTVTVNGVGKATITIEAQVTTEATETTEATTETQATAEVTVKVGPKGTKVSSVKSTKAGKATVKIKKSSAASGYQIRYSTSSKMTKAKTKTLKSAKTTSTTLTKLKKGKKVYVQVRTYKTVDGQKYYSDWSATKSVKVKK